MTTKRRAQLRAGLVLVIGFCFTVFWPMWAIESHDLRMILVVVFGSLTGSATVLVFLTEMNR